MDLFLKSSVVSFPISWEPFPFFKGPCIGKNDVSEEKRRTLICFVAVDICVAVVVGVLLVVVFVACLRFNLEPKYQYINQIHEATFEKGFTFLKTKKDEYFSPFHFVFPKLKN